jgi:23S rRNA (adenine2503-C2)-methyltransferase
MIEKSGIDLGVNLAISLHAVNDELRDKLVPINKKYNLENLIDACKKYPALSNSRRITWEYVMLKDVNDTKEDARNLVKLIEGIPSKINLIPFNPWPGSLFETSTQKNIDVFANIIMDAGFASPIRKPRGQDIFAACGQLKSETQKIRKSQANKFVPVHSL